MRCYTEEDWERWRQLGIANHEAERRLEADARRRWAEVDALAAKSAAAAEQRRLDVQRQVEAEWRAKREAQQAEQRAVWRAAAEAYRAAGEAKEAYRAAAVQQQVEDAERLHQQTVAAVQRQVEDAEQLHRQARRAVRQRVKDAAKREAERVAEAERRKEARRLAQLAPVRPYQVPETYGLNYRETAADEAYYREAIEPYTWR